MPEPIENTSPVEQGEPTEELQEEVTTPQEEEETPQVDDKGQSQDQSTEKLILGKYKTQEEFEAAHLALQGDYTKTKQRLKDPNFVYELAKQAGLAQDDDETTPTTPRTGEPSVADQVNAVLDYKEAIQVFPELTKDPALGAWAAALVDGGMTHVQAANFIKDKLGSVAETAKAEGAKSKEATISEKEAAQTAPMTTNVNPDAAEDAELDAKAKSFNRIEQEDALTKKLMKRMK